MSKPKVFRYTVVEHIANTAVGWLVVTYDAEGCWRTWLIDEDALRRTLKPGDTIKITLEKLP